MCPQDKSRAKSIEIVEWTPWQAQAVREELHLIFSESTFKTSKRCQILLRCLVDHALAGHLDCLKERTLGVEVFGRDAGYDNVADPVVRMTANEIRKRLAQWYLEAGRAHQVKIRLVAGSYLPEFHFESEDADCAPPLTEASSTLNAAATGALCSHTSARKFSTPSPRFLIAAFATLLLVFALASLAMAFDLFRSTAYRIWKPMLASQLPLIICVSDDDSLVDLHRLNTADQSQVIANVINSRQALSSAVHPNPAAVTPWVDADAANRLTEWAASHGHHVVMVPTSAMTLRDLRSGPVILVGGFSNPWSLVMLSNLRFSIRMDTTTQEMWIRDAQNPALRPWKISKDSPGTEVSYALISRFYDTETGQWILSLGGIRPHGTLAAGEFLTDPASMSLLPDPMRTSKNFQLILKNTIINGKPGPPEIVATHIW